MQRHRLVWACLSGILLSACAAGGSGFSPVSPAPARLITSDANYAGRGSSTLNVRVRIPRGRARGRGAHYISAATKAITLSFAGPATVNETIALTPSDPRCAGTPLVCTFPVSLAAGNYRATIDLFDQAPAGGAIPAGAKLLSTARNAAVSVTRGAANSLDVTLDGVPASIVVGGFPSADAGTAFLNKGFNVTVKDADGYTITGRYATPIVLTDTDTSGATAIATAGADNPPAGTLLGSSDTATISYTGSTIAPFKIDATAGAVSGSGLVVVQLPIYVADGGNHAVKEIPPGCTSASCVTTLGGGFSTPVGIAADKSGNVFASDDSAQVVDEIPMGCASAGCVTQLGGGFGTPYGIAIDDSDDVFVADYTTTAIDVIPQGCTAAGCVTTLGAGLLAPTGVAIDASGSAYVVYDSTPSALLTIPAACHSVGCVGSLAANFGHPFGVAVDPSSNVFVADLGNGAVKEIPAGCISTGCIATIGGGFSHPFGIAVDAADDVFVSDLSSSVVKEIPPGCTSASCVVSLGGGFSAPQDVGLPRL